MDEIRARLDEMNPNRSSYCRPLQADRLFDALRAVLDLCDAADEIRRAVEGPNAPLPLLPYNIRRAIASKLGVETP